MRISNHVLVHHYANWADDDRILYHSEYVCQKCVYGTPQSLWFYRLSLSFVFFQFQFLSLYVLYAFVKFCKLRILIVMYVLFCVFCFFVLFYVLFVCKCVLYCTVLYCTTATGCQPNCSKQIYQYHITSYQISTTALI
jgi:hypothetical protein